MKPHYPTSFTDLTAWAQENGLLITDARVRFAQYGVLRAVATSRTLSSVLVFKGGNALDFVWQPNRSTQDLDFSVDMNVPGVALDEALIEQYLSPALAITGREMGIAFRIHRVEQQPPGKNRTFITYRINVGYALSDQPQLRLRIERGIPSSQVIRMDVSLNELICADTPLDVLAANPLRVCTAEDIIAEKLRALLQQPVRNRSRPQDLLDIAVILKETPNIDRVRVADFLQRKAATRGIIVSRRAFREPEVLERARHGYAELSVTTRTRFIPFEEALQALHDFTDILPIPET